MCAYYALNDIKWGGTTLGTPSGQITWNDELVGLPLASGVSQGDIVTSLRSAFNAWEDVAALDFFEGSGNSEIDISFAALDAYPSSVVAVTSWIPRGLYREPSDLQITFDSNEIWTDDPGANPTAINFFAVALHEIGHAIGLDHVPDSTQIMNEFISATALGDGDKAGAQVLYGTDGSDVPVAGEEFTGSPFEGGDVEGGGGGGGAGILLGLLGLVFGLLTGGLGFAAVAAAGRVSNSDIEADNHSDHDDNHSDHDLEVDGVRYHLAFLPEIPFEEFPQIANADEDEPDDFLLF